MTAALDQIIIYPDSDGQPMADNTLQFRWIVLIKENLECVFQDNPDVFVAGDLLWYPVERHPEIRVAPDVMVVFGRPKGERGSYQQWQEGNIGPQVVFEILSPGNRLKEMAKKLVFYDQYAVEEYYIYDPERIDFTGYERQGENLVVIETIHDWVSPRLGIRFVLTQEQLEIYDPQGNRFLTTLEFSERAKLAEQENERLRELLRQAGISDGLGSN
jgi:Uma2 family endonuclease